MATGGGGFAIVLAAIDVVFVARDVIPPIYHLADAAAELLIVAAWFVAAHLDRSAEQPERD